MRTILFVFVVLFWITTAPASMAGVWDQVITTDAEMVPPLSVRFDDIGSRDTMDEDSAHFLIRGMKVSYAVNAFNAGDVSDSLTVSNILNTITVNRLSFDQLEWLQHTNTNMNPALGTNETTDNFSDYYDYDWDRWVLELQKDRIVSLVNNCANDLGVPYQITKADIVGGVWPGDGDDVTAPSRANFARRNPELFNALMDTLGIEYIMVSAGTDAFRRRPATAHFAGAGNLSGAADDALQPFTHHGAFMDRAALWWPGTCDLGNIVVERGTTAKVPWAPASTVEWTLAKNTNYFTESQGAAGLDDYREGSPSNYPKTFRSRYQKATAAGGGLSLIFHDEAASNALTYTFSYPDAGTNNALTSASTVNGGPQTMGDPIDFEYIAAACQQLINEGFFRAATITEHVTWSASRPGKAGLRIAGSDKLRFAWEAIGDTVGVIPPTWVEGLGTAGFAVASPLVLNATMHFRGGDRFQTYDGDYDGKFESYEYVVDVAWDDVTDPTNRLHRIDGAGHPAPGGATGVLLMWDDNGWGPNLTVNYSELLPGEYLLTIVLQGAQAWRFAAQPLMTLYGSGSTGYTAAGYGGLQFSREEFDERTLGPTAATSFTLAVQSLTGGGEVGATDFGDDTWPGGVPATRSQSGWYTIALPFTVPSNVQVDGAFAPTTDFDHATLSRIRGAVAYRLAFLAEDYSGGYGVEEHVRISGVSLRWMGGPNGAID